MITRMLAGFTLVALAFAISGATIDLRVSPDSILPGTSADLVVTVTNSGAEPVVFLAEVALHVSLPVGEPFFATRDFTTNETKFREIPEEFLPAADDDDEDEESPTADEEPQTDDRRVVRIAPGEKFLFEVPFFHNVTFFQDERLTSPGRYGLRAVMVTIEGAEVRSSESILYVVEPAGVDAEVWSEMKRLCSLEPCAWGRWQIRGYDRRILTQFAESSYAKYATSYDFHTRDDAAHRREIGMTGPFREHILLYEADDVLSLALTRAIEREDQAGAVRAANELRRALEYVLDSATDEYVRARAHRALEEVPSASDISALLNEISAAQRDRPVRKIKPLLDCVSPLPGGGWIAWFGYENPFDYDYWLGFSTGKNKFEPQPHERGQPETFKKGGHPRAFSITFDGDPVTWFVKEEKVTVSRTFSTRCSE